MSDVPLSPEKNCDRCPRLVSFRQVNREKFADWHNAPVESFGPTDAALLIVGLAPGLRGAKQDKPSFHRRCRRSAALRYAPHFLIRQRYLR